MDIEEVGDNRHTTFFEMLGNWSFGDYFKKEQIEWMFEFLTKELGLDPERLYVTAFIGDPNFDLPKDTESVQIWKELFLKHNIEAKEVELGTEENAAKVGMQGGRIFYYTSSKNWWSRSGKPENMPDGEPGGPDSEMFYKFSNIEHDPKYGEHCHPNCDCGAFMEIGNQVFMQYLKKDEKFVNLPKQNVDFGGGLERMLSAVNDQPNVFKSDLFWPIIKELEKNIGKKYGENPKTDSNFRVIADHLKAATFLIKDGVTPSNKLQGYILRRLLRRSAVKLSLLGVSLGWLTILVDVILEIYKDTQYFDPDKDRLYIQEVIEKEIDKFQNTLDKGLREISKIEKIDSKKAFDLYQSFGFPIEITAEIFQEKGQEINQKEFKEEFKKHQELSRQSSKELFG